MSTPILKHAFTGDGKHETYILKFKDRLDRAGIKIADKEERVMKIKEIQIYKMPRETNKIVVEIFKA